VVLAFVLGYAKLLYVNELQIILQLHLFLDNRLMQCFASIRLSNTR
jgi:hypothetical protein